MSIMADVYNTLASTNNVTAANDWPVALSYLDGAPCWVNDFTVGFAIAEGHYTSSNVTAAKFLDLVNPGVTYSCPLYLGYGNPTGFAFQPLSHMADSYGCNQQTCMSGARDRTDIIFVGGGHRVLEPGRGLHDPPEGDVHGAGGGRMGALCVRLLHGLARVWKSLSSSKMGSVPRNVPEG